MSARPEPAEGTRSQARRRRRRAAGGAPRLGAVSMALDIRIAGRYRLGRKIGSGSFGDIYLGATASDTRTGPI